MDFYILKKQEKLVAIPADEQNCKEYLDDGYFYVDKVAACNEKSALKALQAKQVKAFKTPAVLLLLVLPIILFAWLQISR
ncbi:MULTISPECIES: hypothetical protein [Pseudoalteromonas]|uniref:Uncharacterized protein n=1 Tax=Pseudoalteromonas amylolytica TaxID=1859457 RepID=A0A1S1MSY8_9GAMM|nr:MULTISPECIES: hypothetical protein [Pseudoalteromonas]MCF6434507.1 hypothetical protein [Pseudoalteromonas sp. MMG022]OHU85076.1 hypothetical protein BFC16_20600 [Pseudoalteromonas sp. JW3]OHU89972.1 hypothetical protein BET10_14375 [Pseudoalteromonas amylolytica]